MLKFLTEVFDSFAKGNSSYRRPSQKAGVAVVAKPLEEENPVAAAVKLCVLDPESELPKLDSQLVAIAEEISTLEARKKNLFGIEAAAHKELDLSIERLAIRKKSLDSTKRFGGKYSKLSLEVFKWRDKNGYPRLAIYGLDSGECRLKSIVVNGNLRSIGLANIYEHTIMPELPAEICVLFNDVYEKRLDFNLREKGTHSWSAIESHFRGVLPDLVRRKIMSAQTEFEKIYIVAEANWEEKSEIKKDPLVIGWDGAHAWLIAAFDLTTLENYIKSEATE